MAEPNEKFESTLREILDPVEAGTDPTSPRHHTHPAPVVGPLKAPAARKIPDWVQMGVRVAAALVTLLLLVLLGLRSAVR